MPVDDAAAARPAEEIVFGDYRLDLAAQQLWRGRRPIALRRKSWQVLVHLAQRPGALIGIDALLDAVWAGVAVTPNTLTNVIAELRQALGDRARPPRVIETVHRRGYRFIAAIADRTRPMPHRPAPAAAASLFVGRAAELERLHALWEQAQRGQRQIVFVAGEPGIGKTTLIERFAAAALAPVAPIARGRASSAPAAWIGRADCIEQHGTGEAYMPLLKIVEDLAAFDTRGVTDALRRCAPTWLAQLPSLLAPAPMDALRATLLGIGPERMLREGVTLLESLAARRPLLLIIDDVHWADPFTPDLIAALAQRTANTALMLLLTYRPVDAVVYGHRIAAVARRLRLRQRAVQLPLAPFTSAEVRAYLAQRHAGGRLRAIIERQSGGNPLFVSALVTHLTSEAARQARDGPTPRHAELPRDDFGIPEDLGGMIAARLAALPASLLAVLEAGSVEGEDLSARSIAAGLDRPVDEVEDLLQQAVQHRIVEACAPRTWPNGASGMSYRFVHALYRRAIYEGLAPSRRRRLHQRIGECLEGAFGAQADAMASQLAMHFAAADDVPRRVRYRELEATAAEGRFAHADAVAHLRDALHHLRRLPATRRRWQREAQLELRLGNAVTFARGSADAAVHDAFVRAEQLARRARAHRERFRALLGLGSVHCAAGSVIALEPVVREQRRMARRLTPGLAAQAAWRAGQLSFAKGELVVARRHFERALVADGEAGIPVVLDFRSLAAIELSLVLALLGHVGESRRVRDDGLRRSAASGLSFSHCQAIWLAALSAAVQRDDDAVRRFSEDCAALAERCTFVSFRSMRPLMVRSGRRTALVEPAFRQALSDNRSISGRWFDTLHAARFAQTCLDNGRVEAALAWVDSGLADVAQLGQHWYAAELWRLKGAALLRRRTRRAPRGHVQTAPEAAEPYLRRAVEIARAQRARLLELRAATSLAECLRRDGAVHDAVALLAPLCAAFDAGVEPADQRDARRLLIALR